MRDRFSLIACLALMGSVVNAQAAGVLFAFDQPQIASVAGLKVDDQRSKQSKKGGRPNFLKPMTYLGDAAFGPGKVSLFESAVASAFATPPQHVVLKSFDVVDVYAMRMGEMQAAAINTVSPAAAAILGKQPPEWDYILCVIEAEVDGTPIAAAAVAPYRGNAFAVHVYKDPAVVAAVKQSVTEALRSWIERAKTQ